MNPVEEFASHNKKQIDLAKADSSFMEQTRNWFNQANAYEYSYHYTFLDRPIIQYPQDMVALQELIWQVKPDLIIETGIAHGGSLIMSASMLALIDYCEAVETGTVLDPTLPSRKVLGVDIDIRSHNREAIEAHPLALKIDMIQGSSIAPDVIGEVHEYAAQGYKKILVILDSNHTHDHVLAELEAYAPLTSVGSYCVVFDTVIEDLPINSFSDRPWGKGNNPKTAVWEFMSLLKEAGHNAVDGDKMSFEIDKVIEDKLLITVAPDGYLKRIS